MSKQRADELTKMKRELTDKFSEALKAIDARIAEESGGGEADDYATVGKCAAELAEQGGTASGILALRMFPRQGGPKPQ